MPKTVLIADDSPYARTAIKKSLERYAFLQVCGEAVDGQDAIDKANELKPDLVILDYAMPRLDGLKAARAMRTSLPGAILVLFTMHSDVVRQADAKAAGINEVFSRTSFGALALYLENVCRPGGASVAPTA